MEDTTQRKMEVERPEIETFGENVGVLTREVFALEVTQSGFHKLLREAVGEDDDFAEIIAKFDRKIGGEARTIVRAFIANRRVDGDDA